MYFRSSCANLQRSSRLGAAMSWLKKKTDLGTDTQPGETVREDQPPALRINDAAFVIDLKRLKQLRHFLINESVDIRPPDSDLPFSLGPLNRLLYDYEKGRSPTEEEWLAVESNTQTLFQLMSYPLRQKFLLSQNLPRLSSLSVTFGIVALVSIVGAIFIQEHLIFGLAVGVSTLPFYLGWLISLGGIGSVAFIGMNALLVQQDATFDLSNDRLINLRISLGSMFGLVLTIPFGFPSFLQFVAQIGKVGGEALSADALAQQAMFLLLPFVLGFSTSLVVLVLNRLIDAIQTIFGRFPHTLPPPPPPNPTGFSARARSTPPPPPVPPPVPTNFPNRASATVTPLAPPPT